MWFSSHWTEQNQEKILQALPRNTTRYLTIVVFKRGHLNLCDASIFTVEHDELDDRESMLVYLWTLISHRAIVCTPSKENWTHVKICHLETFRGIYLINTKLYLSLPFVLWSVFTCIPVVKSDRLNILSSSSAGKDWFQHCEHSFSYREGSSTQITPPKLVRH